MQTLIKAGRLISTTDMKLAEKLQTIINLNEITAGKTPQAIRQNRARLSFMLAGEYYELERVK